MKILIIEDDLTLNRLLAENLRQNGYETLSATAGDEGLRLASDGAPDLVIVDIMMPGTDGWAVCRRLREISNVPIIFLTAKVSQEDVIRGLNLGADDYVKKPFDLQELILRIEALLRRSKNLPQEDAARYEDGVLSINLERRLVLRCEKPVHLTPTEFRLLSYLVRQRGTVVPHGELLTQVWGPEYATDTAILSVYVRYLREKLEDEPSEPRYIQTEWGIGYRFRDSRDQILRNL